MKTAKDRAEAWLIEQYDAKTLDSWTEEALDNLEIAFKEISRDTRHACANATICYPAHTTAYEACMNVKAV